MKSIRSVWKPLAVTMGALVALVAGAGPAQASVVKSQTNLVQPAPFPQNKQNEPAIAQNPTDATNLVAGANDEIDLPGCTTSGCPFVTNVGLSGVYVSHDGGASWSQFSAAAGAGNTASFNGGHIHTLPRVAKLARPLRGPRLASDRGATLGLGPGVAPYYRFLARARRG